MLFFFAVPPSPVCCFKLGMLWRGELGENLANIVLYFLTAALKLLCFFLAVTTSKGGSETASLGERAAEDEIIVSGARALR